MKKNPKKPRLFTSLLPSWNQGCLPYVKISHKMTPKLHTSLSVENFLYMMLSGGIQRMGSMVCPPTWLEKRKIQIHTNKQHTHTSRRIFSHQWNSRASGGIKWYRGFNISWMSAAIAAGWRRITHHLLHYAVVKSFSGGRVLNDTIVGGGEHLQLSAPRKSSDHFVDSNGWKATAGVAFMQMFNVCLHPECIGYVPFVFISKAKL